VIGGNIPEKSRRQLRPAEVLYHRLNRLGESIHLVDAPVVNGHWLGQRTDGKLRLDSPQNKACSCPGRPSTTRNSSTGRYARKWFPPSKDDCPSLSTRPPVTTRLRSRSATQLLSRGFKCRNAACGIVSPRRMTLSVSSFSPGLVQHSLRLLPLCQVARRGQRLCVHHLDGVTGKEFPLQVSGCPPLAALARGGCMSALYVHKRLPFRTSAQLRPPRRAWRRTASR